MNSLTRTYVQRKRKSRKGGSHSTLSLLRRELREGTLQSLFGGSSYLLSSSTNAAPDPLLSSFILPMPDDFGSSQLHSSAESVSVKKSTNENITERYVIIYIPFSRLYNFSYSVSRFYLCKNMNELRYLSISFN